MRGSTLIPVAVGAFATSFPLVRDRMLSRSERADLAKLLVSMEDMQSLKKQVKILGTEPYWGLMLELDKVAVYALRDELDL